MYHKLKTQLTILIMRVGGYNVRLSDWLASHTHLKQNGDIKIFDMIIPFEPNEEEKKENENNNIRQTGDAKVIDKGNGNFDMIIPCEHIVHVIFKA